MKDLSINIDSLDPHINCISEYLTRSVGNSVGLTASPNKLKKALKCSLALVSKEIEIRAMNDLRDLWMGESVKVK